MTTDTTPLDTRRSPSRPLRAGIMLRATPLSTQLCLLPLECSVSSSCSADSDASFVSAPSGTEDTREWWLGRRATDLKASCEVPLHPESCIRCEDSGKPGCCSSYFSSRRSL
eukprot:2923074-Rhodomonas_salina.1